MKDASLLLRAAIISAALRAERAVKQIMAFAGLVHPASAALNGAKTRVVHPGVTDAVTPAKFPLIAIAFVVLFSLGQQQSFVPVRSSRQN